VSDLKFTEKNPHLEYFLFYKMLCFVEFEISLREWSALNPKGKLAPVLSVIYCFGECEISFLEWSV